MTDKTDLSVEARYLNGINLGAGISGSGGLVTLFNKDKYERT